MRLYYATSPRRWDEIPKGPYSRPRPESAVQYNTDTCDCGLLCWGFELDRNDGKCDNCAGRRPS
jgi:hypothetical protein